MPRLCLLAFLIALPVIGQPTSRPLVDKYCSTCHSQKLKTAGLVLEGLDPAHAAENSAIWEKVIRQMGTRQMPPPGLPRPDAATSAAFTKSLVNTLDRAAALRPDPGSTRPQELMNGLKAHLREAGVGQLSEIADGDAPHTPGGCFAQAWSVAEILRFAAENHGNQAARPPDLLLEKKRKKANHADSGDHSGRVVHLARVQ